MSLESGVLLAGRYRIERVLGKGGFGAVYLAHDESLGVPCAVKENLSLSPETERQFRREATLLANLRHAHLPRVTNHFILAGQQYLVMDFVEGEDLKQRLESDGPLPLADVLRWAAQICEALTYLHGRIPPIIHRDIKPGNIKLTAAGDAVLVDFGIAKASAAGQQTTTSAMGLTPGFAPPEQYGTGGTDARTDEYALAATLYTLLTGQVPPDSMERLLGAATLASPAALRPDLPPHVSSAIVRALAINPDERFRCVADFNAVLLGELPLDPASAEALSAECFSEGAALAGNVTTPAPARSETRRAATRRRPEGDELGQAVAPKPKRRGLWLVLGLLTIVILGGLAALAGTGVLYLIPQWAGLTTRTGPAGGMTETAVPPSASPLSSPAPVTSTPVPPSPAMPGTTPTRSVPTETPFPTVAPAEVAPATETSTVAPAKPTAAAAASLDLVPISAASAPYLVRRALLGESGLAPFALSPDGKSVALTNSRGVDLVDLASGQTAGHLEAFWGRTRIVAVGVLADSLLIQSPDLINRWSFSAGTFRKYPIAGRALYLSGDGRIMVVPGEKYGQIIDLASGRQLASNQGNPNSYYQLTPDGAYLAWVDPGDQAGSLNLVQWVEVSTGKTVRMLAGHGKPLGALAVSPDGQRLFSASGDIWDTASGKLLATFDCSARGIAISADGRVIVASDGEEYDAATGEHLGRLAGFEATSLAFTADGTRLVVQKSSQEVEVWEVDFARLEAALATPQAVDNVATESAPLGETISPSNTARLTLEGWWGNDPWLETRLVQDAAYNRAGQPAVIFGGAYSHIAFSGDGRRFLGVSNTTVEIVDIATRKVVDRLDGVGSAVEAVFLGDQFVLVSNGSEVERWELATHKAKQSYSVAGHSLVASPDGTKFALQDKRYVYVVDVVTGEAPEASSDPNCDFLFTPDSRYLASTSGVNVGLWDVTSRQLKVLPGKLGVKTAGLVFSADGQELYSATGDIWDWQAQKWVRKFAGGAGRVAVSPDGRLIVGNTGALYDGVGGNLVGSLLDVRGQADNLAFTPDGAQLIWHTPQGAVYVWGLSATAAPAPTVPAQPDAITASDAANLTLQGRWGKGRLWSAQWSPDEKYLAVNTSLNTVIYEADTLNPVQTYWGSLTLAIGPAHQAAVVNSDGLKIFDIATGRELMPMVPLPGVVAAAFSPDGATLAIAGQVEATGPSDGMALLTVADGNVSVLEKGWGRYKAALGTAFSPDGKYLAVSFRGAAWVWEVATRQAHPVISNVTLPLQFSPDSQYVAYFTDRQMLVERVASGTQFFSAKPDGTPYFPSSYEIDAYAPLSLQYLSDGSLAVFYQTQRGHLASLARWPIGQSGGAPLVPQVLLNEFAAFDNLRGVFAGEYDANRTYRIPLLALGPAGARFCSLTADGVVRVWDAKTGQPLAATAPDYLPQMALSPDGQTAALVNALGNVDLLDLASGRVVATFPSRQPKALIYNGPSVLLQLYPGGEEGDHLGVVNTTQKTEMEDAAGAYFTKSRDFSMSYDGRLLAFWTTVNYQDVLGVFTLALNQPLFTLGKYNAAQYVTAFSPDGRYLARINGKTVEFYNIQTRQLEKDKTLTGKRALQGNLAFSADGQRLVAASGEIWDMATGTVLANFASQTRQVALSPDGRVIAGLDGSLWEADTGRLLGQLPGRLGVGSQIVFTADGRRLVWQTQTGLVQVWGTK